MRLCIVLITVSLCGKTFYLIPPRGIPSERLFACVEDNDPWLNHDDSLLHFYRLRQSLRQDGHELVAVEPSFQFPPKSCIMTSGILDEKTLKQLKRFAQKVIAFIWEPITMDPLSYDKKAASHVDAVFTLWDDQVDNKKYHKHYYTYPHIFMMPSRLPFNEKRLLTCIASNKDAYANKEGELYTERIKAILFFSDSKADFVFYGTKWPPLPTYGGAIQSKKQVLNNFKFCLCFENTGNMNGYITEKIFDCFHAGCVPIYLGAPNIASYIPSTCFIDMRAFESYDKLYTYIRTMPEARWHLYIKNIQRFLASPQARLFSIEHFIKQVKYVLYN